MVAGYSAAVPNPFLFLSIHYLLNFNEFEYAKISGYAHPDEGEEEKEEDDEDEEKNVVYSTFLMAIKIGPRSDDDGYFSNRWLALFI